MFRDLFWDDECIIVRAVLLSRDRLLNFTLGIGSSDVGSGLCSSSPGSSCSIAGSMGASFPLESTGVLLFLAALSLFLLWWDLERRLRRCFGGLSRGLSFVASSPSPSFGVSTIYIYHMMRWQSSAQWAVVPVLLLRRRKYRRRLWSRNRACR